MLALLLLAGCSADRTVAGTYDAGHGPFPPTSIDDTAPPSPSSSATPATSVTSPAPATTAVIRTASPPVRVTPTSAPPATTTTTTTTRPSTAVNGRTLCADDTAVDTLTSCLRSALSTFWSGELNDTVDEPVVLDPRAAAVPAECRRGLTAAPAFTCRSDRTLYVTASLLSQLRRTMPGDDLFYAVASLQSHEFGHVLQYQLGQPEVARIDTDARSRFVEQQADCLSGVWAQHAGSGFDQARFRRVALRLITLVSSNSEVAGHGTPAARLAAIDRGLRSGRPQSCRLVTFG